MTFTDPVASSPAAENTVTSFINTTVARLDVAAYTFTYSQTGGVLQNLAGAMEAARNHGVWLRLVTDVDEVSSPTSSQFVILDTLDGLRDNQLNPSNVCSGNPGGTMHDKFMIADGARVLTGSANFTHFGLYEQENNVLVLGGLGMAGSYRSEFEQMFNSRVFGNDGWPKTARYFTTDDYIPVETWFGADDDLTGRIVSAIDAATTSAYFCIFAFSTGAKADQIAAALKRAASRGVDVRGVMDEDEGQWATLADYPGVSLADYIGPEGLMHHKYLVIDADTAGARILTGSNNWSTSADSYNDENMLVLSSKSLANTYFDNFRKLYVERSSTGSGSAPVRKFGDLDGDNQLTLSDYQIALAISSGSQTPTRLQLITGDVAPSPGLGGHSFGDGVIDAKDAEWLGDKLGLPPSNYGRAGEVLREPDGATIATGPLIVTASFGSIFYAQEPDRSAGIRVQGAAATAGSLLKIGGTMATLASGGGERYISSPVLKLQSTGNPLPNPLIVSCSQMGGAAPGSPSPGIAGAPGSYNIGLRVAVTGRVSAWGTLCFWIDDRSGASDSSGNPGVKVNSGALERPQVGSWARVTGISSMETFAGYNVRLLRPATSADIETIIPAP